MHNFRNPYIIDVLDFVTRHWLLILLALSPIIGFTGGMSAADSIAEQAERQHNLVVIATVNIAAKRYSRIPDGTQDCNLYPELCDKRYSMMDLDDYYR